MIQALALRPKPPREAREAVVIVDGVSKTYVPSPPLMRALLRSALKAPVVAVDGVSLRVESGEICAIVGPNGAGKSTLFRILTGLTSPSSGRAFVAGFDVDRQSFHVRRRIGFHAADERMLLGRHSCRENLLFHGRLQGMPERALRRRVDEVLELVGLQRAGGRLAHALSSGMKARLQLARALLHHPEVLILDEPTGSLDPVAAYRFLELLRAVAAERGIAVLISSHRLEEIEALPDHVLLLNEGRVVYDGHLDDLRRYWDTPRLEARFSSSAAAAAAAAVLASIDQIEVAGVDDDVVVLKTTLGLGNIISLADGQLGDLTSIGEVRMPLRDLLAELLVPSGNT